MTAENDSVGMSHSLAKVAIHLVFATKDREPVLADQIRSALHGYMATVLRNLRSPAVVINSMEDHVHILFELGRTVALSSAVEGVKRTSSRWIKTQGTEFAGFSWQSGYGAFAVSASKVAQVRRYIERQREHHESVMFEDEYRAFLQRHGVAYDEAYLWT
jgi:putative transposase